MIKYMKFFSFINESDVWHYFEKTTDMPFYDDMMNSPDYFRKNKKLAGKIEMMSPYKYYQECGKLHKSSAAKQEEVVDPLRVEVILKSIQDKGTKMNLPLLDYAYETQEGRHRAKIAEKLGLKQIPVMVVHKV